MPQRTITPESSVDPVLLDKVASHIPRFAGHVEGPPRSTIGPGNAYLAEHLDER